MTVSLGGIVLSDHLVLDIGPSGVAHSQRRLIGGASLLQVDGNSGGRQLTLGGTNHWTLGQVEQIRALEAAALPVLLVHHRGTFSVVITSTADLQPMRAYANPIGSDRYSGTITLIEV
jgi:hypothetical protein